MGTILAKQQREQKQVGCIIISVFLGKESDKYRKKIITLNYR